jgi:glyoxylase-like metal-dependent hydrolase (beta-lactamase superfamily II)
MAQHIPLRSEDQAVKPDYDDSRDDGTHEVTPDLAYKRLLLVNVLFYGQGGATDRHWVLIDTGIMGMAPVITRTAAERFGFDARPAAIILTHGHFDHVGTVELLADQWQVPVYAHPLELPYLNGSAAYPPPDPAVGGGLMSLISPLYPQGPVNIRQWLRPLPPDGTVPEMPGWQWIHVPGHTPGQVALWREQDRSLIAADAFITTRQESAYAVATQAPELHGPPMYFTQNWQEAHSSVQRLAALEPELVVSGHGRAMHGSGLRRALHTLAQDFTEIAVPRHGRYIVAPTTVADGSAYVLEDETVPLPPHDNRPFG